jgi:trehalose-6-phosphate synthase
MVRDKLPNATIGFFLHINFPSSEIFRCLPVRQELLLGMLGADLVGFQTYNLARHFRQTCQRLLSVEATPKGIQLPTGFSRVGVFSIGIDVKALNERKKEAEVAEWLATLRERYAGFKVLIARDKLDEIKGVRKKLEAYECFLEKYPHWQGKVVLIQVAMATTLENEKQGEVMDVVSRINTKYSTFT